MKYWVNLKLPILIFLLFSSYLSIAQTYTLGSSPATNNATINTCAGTFVDSNVSSGNYGNNENTTVTFCSNNSKQMVMNFSAFSLQVGACQNDYLQIFDGNSTSATLIGTFCGTNSPGIITASGTCLTVKFVSDANTVSTGWQAALSCYECIDNSTCADQYIDLDFSSTTTKTEGPGGTANWVGDEWRFNNVYTGTYAKAKIVAVQNVVTAAVSNIDNATQPFPEAWSPELGFNIVGGQDSYVDWEVTFYDNTTNNVKPLPKASRVTSYDVDGPNNRNPYTELHGHTSPDGYIVGSGSLLSVLNEPPRTIVLGTPQEFDGISNNDISKVTFYYSTALTVFKIRLGIRAAAGASGSVPARQYALGFVACPNFTNPVVTPIIPIITGANKLCINGNLTQTYSLPNNFNNIVWSVSGGTIVSGQGTQNLTVTWPATIGNYKVSVVTTDGSSCVVNNSRSVTVVPAPTATASGSTVCEGQTINLTSSGGTSYAWTGPLSFTSTLQNPTRSAASTGMVGTYTVTVTDANGCTSTANATVVVNTTPTITLTSSQAQACRGTTNVTLSYSATSGSPTTFSIVFASGISNITNAAFTGGTINIPISGSLAVGTYSGTLTVNNALCSSGNIPITVQIFDPVIVVAGGNLTVCVNTTTSPIPLTGASVTGGVTTGAWSVVSGGGTLSNTGQTGSPASVTYTPPAYIPSGNYSIDVVLQLTSPDPSGPCPSVFATRTLSINYLTGGTITSNQTICIDGDPNPIGN